jgi:hypothetical protein
LADPDLHRLVIGFDPLLSCQSEVGLKSAIEKVIDDFKSDLGGHGTTAVSEGAEVLDGSILALRGAVVDPHHPSSPFFTPTISLGKIIFWPSPLTIFVRVAKFPPHQDEGTIPHQPAQRGTVVSQIGDVVVKSRVQ